MRKILLFTILSLLFACKDGDKGEPAAGTGYFRTDGTTSGTIKYYYENGDRAILPTSFSAYTSVLDQTYYIDEDYGYYYINVERYDPNESSNYLKFYICDAYYDNTKSGSARFTKPSSIMVYFNYLKPTNPFFQLSNEYNPYDYYYHTYYQGETLTLSNYSLDPSTGHLTFSYQITIDPNSIPYGLRASESYPNLSGTVDVYLTKSPYNNSFCADYDYDMSEQF